MLCSKSSGQFSMAPGSTVPPTPAAHVLPANKSRCCSPHRAITNRRPAGPSAAPLLITTAQTWFSIFFAKGGSQSSLRRHVSADRSQIPLGVCEVAHTSLQNISRRLTGLGRRRGDRAMAAGDEATICEICKRGRVTKRTEEMAFRQWSDKGYIHCRVTLLAGTCDNCPSKSLVPSSAKILDEAFQREYDKLP